MFAALLVLPALALANPVFKRDGASIQQALSYVNSNITALNTTVTGFKSGDIVTAFTILTESDNLNDALTNAGKVVNASAPLSESESGNVAFSVLNLEPNVFSLLDNLVAHKPEFQTILFGGSADSLVESNLKTAKSNTDSFGSSLVTKLTPDYQAAAPSVINQIDAKFDDAITAFST